MHTYYDPQEYFIERVAFSYKENYYFGTGMMTWSPEKGFHITARVKQKRPFASPREIRTVSIDPRPNIRMKLEDDYWAIAANVKINEVSLLFNGDISLYVSRVIFIQKTEQEQPITKWFGSALYETHSNLTLPDKVTRETRIGDWRPSNSFSRTGLYYDTDKIRVVGQLENRKDLEISWSLPTAEWLKQESLRFAEAFCDALSIITGENIQLKYFRSHRHYRIITDIRKPAKASSLGVIFRAFDYDVVDKELVLRLATFFTHNDQKSLICRQMFRQMSDAAKQQTRQASELLLATIMEATLRSLYNQPFDANNNKRSDGFSIESSLKKFREQYFSSSIETGRKWKKAMNKVVETQRRLRDRNAHPDWLTSQGGALSTQRIKETANDMIFLSRFYGYIILALSDVPDLEPLFPVSFDEWNPLVTIIQKPKDSNES